MPLHAGNVSHAAHVVSLGESLQIVEQLVRVDAELGQFLEVQREVVRRRLGGRGGRHRRYHTQPDGDRDDGHRAGTQKHKEYVTFNPNISLQRAQ